ncbi:hypothetical protein EGR_04750 [Echinococcus granulosus]|uniref:Uncharacterized protein n=1 Tax=Echinococcus granulosus TaxID=6210 RepID=W6UH59_ECHGR|nr:hypothetical protein EGR_04750 [Echinococcus granulosus]EUB60368.1 hypothetical protein EGR_04750 [Echinococcus granulosus]
MTLNVLQSKDFFVSKHIVNSGDKIKTASKLVNAVSFRNQNFERVNMFDTTATLAADAFGIGFHKLCDCEIKHLKRLWSTELKHTRNFEGLKTRKRKRKAFNVFNRSQLTHREGLDTIIGQCNVKTDSICQIFP